MPFKVFLSHAAIVSAFLLLAIGCDRFGNNDEQSDTARPAAANRPQMVEPAEAPGPKNAQPDAPKIAPSNPPFAGSTGPDSLHEPKLKPLVLDLPADGELAPKPLFSSPPPKPLPSSPKAAMPKEPAPLKPLLTGADVQGDYRKIPPLSTVADFKRESDQKPQKNDDSMLANPLRGNSRPEPSQNPIRDNSIVKNIQPVPAVTTPKTPSQKPPKTIQKPGPKPTPSKKSASTFDPVKENGPIFVDWPKPKLAVVITGREDGYIEPCGCAGLDRMKGGLSRRHTMIEDLRKKGWPLLCVDVGGLSKGYGVQAELKFQITVDAMKKMGYKAVGFSPNDLRLPVDSLVAVAAGSEDNPSPFVSANIGLLGFDAEITSQWRVVDVGGVKVGVTSVIGPEFAKGLGCDDIEIEDPEAALRRVVPELKKRCKLMVLLAYASIENSIELSKKFPEFAVVATAGGPPSPPAKPTVVKETKALLIEIGEKGMDAIVLGLYADKQQPYRYQRVPLDSRFPGSKDMMNLMVAYQDRLRTLDLEGLAIKPVTHPSHEVNGEFVGSQACESCHEDSYQIWKKSGHAKAWSTLLNNDPPRDADPECISCHVIGWHPTKHFPYKGGFLSEKLTPKMLDVGCESCHGPGGQHVKAEMGADESYQLRMQKAVRVTKEEAQNRAEKACQNCHDLDNSPDFKFETYWPKVEHSESE